MLDILILSFYCAFKFYSLQCTEVVSAAEDIAAVSVESRVKIVEERKHLRSVPSAAKNDEEARRLTLYAATRPGRIEGRKDIEKTKLDKANK